MSNRFDAMDMSELEREFEFEMEAESDDEFEGEFEEEFEFELDDEFEFEADDEFEGMEDQEYGNDYAERFYELSQRQFESESEVDTAINEVLDDMEREYFFGKALRGIKNIAKKVSKNQVFKTAFNAAKSLASKHPAFKALQGVTQLARGNLRGMLGSLAKAGLGSMVPGGAAILPALQALGFKETELPEDNREAWNNYVMVAREAYETMANSITDQIDNPMIANQKATSAFQQALKKASSGRGRKRYSRGKKVRFF
ncbi:MAG: hypothetical protein ACOX5R_06440 [bacterium]|jgi:hypothetical protein